VRPDLEVLPQYFRGKLNYVVKDPVRLNYFRIGQLEYLVLKALQDGITREQLHNKVKAYTGIDLNDRMLQDAVRSLAVCNFLVTRGTMDSERFYQTRASVWRARLLQWFSNYLFIQLPLWNPDRIMNRISPLFGWMWGWGFFALWLIALLSAAVIVLTNFPTLVSGAFSLLSGWNLLALSVAIFSTKFFHEMAHGLSCKHFGGDVHEMGFALLVFNPCMYCDTTDAWRFSSKWQRMLVGAAGMYIEIFMASLAAFVWIVLEPGFTKTFSYACMVTCSVSTVLFNANPLLRYDGYYILSDFLEIPNLRQRTQSYISYLFNKYILGSDAPDPELEVRDRAVYLAYAVPAFLYRFLILFSIGILLFNVFAPMGIMMMLSTIWGMFIAPIGKTAKRILEGRSVREQKRFMAALILAGLGLFGIWMIPIDYTVKAPCAVIPLSYTFVRSPIPGQVSRVLVREGDYVRKGDLLAEIVNRDWLKRLEGREAELEAVRVRRRQALVEDASAYKALTLQEQEILAEIDLINKEIENGRLIAPHNGYVCNARARESAVRQGGFTEVMLLDNPLGPAPEDFEGIRVNVGDGLMCISQRSDGNRYQILVLEDDMRKLRLNLDVRLKLAAYPDREFEAKVIDISPAEQDRIENMGLTAADEGTVPVEQSGDEPAPLVKVYLIEAEPAQQDSGMRWGMTGIARITYNRGPVGSFYLGKALHKIYKKWYRVG